MLRGVRLVDPGPPYPSPTRCLVLGDELVKACRSGAQYSLAVSPGVLVTVHFATQEGLRGLRVPLQWTGERFLPGVGAEISHYHYGRYFFAAQFCRGRRVLDIPSGEGFGSAILATSAESVVGMDISEDAVAHAQEKYGRANLRFEMAELAQIPVDDGHVGVVVCLEGIEHVGEESQARALSEFRRILSPDGVLIISSPNRYTYSDLPEAENPYHIHEFYTQEFREFLHRQFRHLYMFGQNLQDGSILFPISARSKSRVTFLTPSSADNDEFTETATDPDTFKYQVAVCAQQPIKGSLRLAHVTVDVRQKIGGIRTAELQEKLRALTMGRDGLLAERDGLLAERDGLLAERDGLLAERDGLLAERDGLLAERDATLYRATQRLRRVLAKFPLAESLAQRSLRGYRSISHDQIRRKT